VTCRYAFNSSLTCRHWMVLLLPACPPPLTFTPTLTSTSLNSNERKELLVGRGVKVGGVARALTSTPPPHTEAPRRFPSTVGFLWGGSGESATLGGARGARLHPPLPPHSRQDPACYLINHCWLPFHFHWANRLIRCRVLMS